MSFDFEAAKQQLTHIAKSVLESRKPLEERVEDLKKTYNQTIQETIARINASDFQAIPGFKDTVRSHMLTNHTINSHSVAEDEAVLAYWKQLAIEEQLSILKCLKHKRAQKIVRACAAADTDCQRKLKELSHQDSCDIITAMLDNELFDQLLANCIDNLACNQRLEMYRNVVRTKNIPEYVKRVENYDAWLTNSHYRHHLKNDEEKRSIIRIVMLMSNVHLTRIDIAFDFINCKYAGMRHVLIKPGTTNTNYKDLQEVDFHGRSGAFETKYLGKRRSLSMVRYYDKLVEQAKAHVSIPKNVESWERLELQLRGDRSSQWVEQSEKMLDLFKLPEVETLDNITDKVNLLILTEHPEIFKDFSKEKKAKYRKMYRENQGMNIEYAKNAEKVFFENVPKIQNEIDDFLAKLGQK